MKARTKIRDDIPTKKDICYQHMAAAYADASDNGSFPAIARQMAYAVRRRSGLGDDLRLDYLLKGANNTGLIDQYIRDHPEETADWDVVRDERGTFSTPSGHSVPLGTIAVRDEIARIRRHSIKLSDELEDGGFELTIPKKGPLDDYSGVLYIEKAGFTTMLEEVGLLRRRDLAVASSKGFSVRACRALLDFLRRQKVPIFVAHDFDKAGIGIAAAILREIPWAKDIGLRWADVTNRAFGHPDSDLRHPDYSESVDYGESDPRPNLITNEADLDEINFLCDTTGVRFSGRRVELNALVGREFITWLEARLQGEGLKRAIPDAAHLEASYRRAYRLARVNEAIADAWVAARDEAAALPVPADLRTLVRDGLEASEEQAWDDVIGTLVSDHLVSRLRRRRKRRRRPFRQEGSK